MSKGTTSSERSSRAAAKAVIGKVRLGASIVLSKSRKKDPPAPSTGTP